MSLDIPDKCPICGRELSIDDIDYQPRGDEIVSMLMCPKCNFKKKLDVPDMDGMDDEEDDDDFDPMVLLKDPDENGEDEKDDEEGVNLFPNGRDYDAEDEDGP